MSVSIYICIYLHIHWKGHGWGHTSEPQLTQTLLSRLPSGPALAGPYATPRCGQSIAVCSLAPEVKEGKMGQAGGQQLAGPPQPLRPLIFSSCLQHRLTPASQEVAVAQVLRNPSLRPAGPDLVGPCCGLQPMMGSWPGRGLRLWCQDGQVQQLGCWYC